MVHRKIIRRIRRRVRRIFKKPAPTPTRPSLPIGTAVGTGIKGGVLVTTADGGVKEVFQDRPDQPLDPSRAAAIRRGVGGARPASPLIIPPKITFTPQEQQVIKKVEQRRQQSLSGVSRQDIIRRRRIQQAKQAFLGRPPGVIRPVEEPEGRISKTVERLRTQTGILETKQLRGDITEKEKIQLFLSRFGLSIALGVEGVVSIPETLRLIKEDPSILGNVPSALATSGVEIGETLRTSPQSSLGIVAGNLVLFAGSAGAIKNIGKLSGSALARTSPKFAGKLKTGQTFKIKTDAGRTVNVKVVGKIPTEALRKQVALAGKKVTGISAQADRLLGIIKTTKKIRKPIPNEASFNPLTKRLLVKFDNKTITRLELIRLEGLLRRQGAKGLLERAFFIDPRGRIRPSRLGVFGEKTRLTKPELRKIVSLEKKGRLTRTQQTRLEKLRERRPFTIERLVDRFTSDITFRQSKPQILLFEDIKVAKFPKSLDSVKRKLLRGQALTKKEANALLEFQLKTSGKAKPIGFTSKESEIVLAPGEVLKKEKTLAITIIDGRRIPIIKTSVFKPKGETKRLLTRFKKGTKPLTKKEQKKLDRLLKKQTGFDYGIGSSARTSKRFVSLKRIGLSGLLTRAKKIRPSRPGKPSRVPRRPSRPSKPSRPTRPSRPIKPSKPSKPISRKVSRPISPRPPTKPPIRPPIKPPVKPPIVPPPILKKKVRRIKKRKKQLQAFDVLARPRRKKGAKKIPKLIKINKVPLSRRNARNLRNKVLDTSLARTGRIRPTKGKPQRPLLKVPKNFAKQTTGKFRTFRRVKGKKIPLRKGKVIEKSRFLLDTKAEKRSITLSRRIAQLNKQARLRQLPKTIRTLKSKRRVSQKTLDALARGRKIRLQNLKKKR